MQAILNQYISFKSPTFYLLWLLVLLLLSLLYADAFVWMADKWFSAEEYSHGVMIPFVSAYLVWQRRDNMVHENNGKNFPALFLILSSLLLFIISDLATVYVGVILSSLLCLYGVVLLNIGWKNMKEILIPLLILIFMVPIPAFINNNLSAQLQLISSELGVAFIRLFDISVYLEGNIIDLGSYKLQVVEACSGLRYLYPLVALGFILAYLCKIPVWQKGVIFLSTLPITVIMNSIRIGAIGVSVEYWGPAMAEGLLHDIEGWFMFMASLAILLMEIIFLLKIMGDKRTLSQVINIDAQTKAINGQFLNQRFNLPLYKVLIPFVLVLLTSIFMWTHSKSVEYPIERIKLNHFPLLVGQWYGIPKAMDQIYIDELDFDDYIVANYEKGDARLNFYIAYYDSQKSGESAHSPRSCIPGGGWKIESLEQVQIGDLMLNSQDLIVNRAIINKGDVRQVVYYWFQQRGRIITNEYLVKWYIFWDSLIKNRSDGALVRLTVPLGKGENVTDADDIFYDFMGKIQYRINDFIPD